MKNLKTMKILNILLNNVNNNIKNKHLNNTNKKLISN